MNRVVLFILLKLFSLGVVFSGEKNHSVVLEWDKPVKNYVAHQKGGSIIYFDGAIFGDTLANIPFYLYQEENNIPFFRKEFSIKSEKYIPVTAEEQLILEEAGYDNQEVRLFSGIEYAGKQSISYAGVYPFRYNLKKQQYEKLQSFILEINEVYDPQLRYEPVQEYVENSVLAQGSWCKICVDKTGIYRLTYDDLQELGVDVAALSKQDISLFGNGGGMLPEANDEFRHDDLSENAIYISGNNTGSFTSSDYILFYATGPDRWKYDEDQKVFRHKVHLYSNKSCYFLTTDNGQGKRITEQQSTSQQACHTVTKFQDYAFHQSEQINLLESGQMWLGEVFDATLSRTFEFPFQDIDTSVPGYIESSLVARSGTSSSFSIKAGNEQILASVGSVDLNSTERLYARSKLSFSEFMPDQPDNVNVRITYNRTSSGSKGWLYYITLNVTRHLRYSGSQMGFRNVDVAAPGNIAQYTIGNASGAVIWDVTDPFNVKKQETTVTGSSLNFRLTVDSLREFVAFDGSAYLEPLLEGPVANQNLHALPSANLIIVTPAVFMEQANRLADYRRENDGLSAIVVTTEQIYNEFSSGSADISAVRNFVKMFYDRAARDAQKPHYLLLFGNGTVDNKDRLGFGGNFIPTYQSVESLDPSGYSSSEGTHMTDDYFGLLDDNEGLNARGIIDLGIGRLPVRTMEEASAMVDKIIRYDRRVEGMEPWADNIDNVGLVSNYGDWRNTIVMVADDEDGNQYLIQAEGISSYMKDYHQDYNIDKIYIDSYTQITTAGGARYPEVNQAINNRVNKGALLINYIGHGGVKGLAHERILTFEDIANWKNLYNMPVLMTATCEFSSFDQPDPEELSAGVRIALKPEGGAIALFTTTRLAWSGNNLTLNTNFMHNAFYAMKNGEMPRLGDNIRIAKQKSSEGGNLNWRLRNFVLLGDPSMRMAYPRHKVVTEEMPDTIMAFQKITISGFVSDNSGNKLEDYQGVIYPTIYDKEKNYQTLGNDPGSNPRDFKIRNSLLYKGKASIVNGEFSFSFEVPRDIAYNFDKGKISYYFDNGQEDGHGYYDSFIVGGTSDGEFADNTGPSIRMFMNDTTFLPGGMTDQNPVLLALIEDESGINLTGRVGHDIVAYLNQDTSTPFVLNQYYQADMDTYKTGRVVFPFSNLPDGHHTLSIRAWDIHNNSAVESLDFIVQNSAQMALLELMNYPNPFSEKTNFVFKHNQSFQELDVQIDIFDLNGRLLINIEEKIQSAGYQSQPVSWDGNDFEGKPLGNGIYVYRVSVTDPGGQVLQQTNKLVILR